MLYGCVAVCRVLCSITNKLLTHTHHCLSFHQGENNVYECLNGVDPSVIDDRSSYGGPYACGDSTKNTGMSLVYILTYRETVLYMYY